jgi:hypothetical protein
MTTFIWFSPLDWCAVPTVSVVDPQNFDADPDAYPYSTYHPDVDPDSDFYFI